MQLLQIPIRHAHLLPLSLFHIYTRLFCNVQVQLALLNTQIAALQQQLEDSARNNQGEEFTGLPPLRKKQNLLPAAITADHYNALLGKASYKRLFAEQQDLHERRQEHDDQRNERRQEKLERRMEFAATVLREKCTRQQLAVAAMRYVR